MRTAATNPGRLPGRAVGGGHGGDRAAAGGSTPRRRSYRLAERDEPYLGQTAPDPVEIALLTVGDELLAGDSENTNANWLARRLIERGVTVTYVLFLPDDRDVIAGAVRDWAGAFDALVVTGGLGGTHDDVTMGAVTDAFEFDLVASVYNVDRAIER